MIGMTQNLYVASATRLPSASGIYLRQTAVVTGSSVYDVLKRIEELYPLVGTSLIPVFYTGGTRIKEIDREFWKKAQQLRKTSAEDGKHFLHDQDECSPACYHCNISPYHSLALAALERLPHSTVNEVERREARPNLLSRSHKT
jgi:hypothetical protein